MQQQVRWISTKTENCGPFPVEKMRDTWFKTSYLLDRNQCGPVLAKNRFVNYKQQLLHFRFPSGFSGKFSQYGINPGRMAPSGIHSAIIREKGVNAIVKWLSLCTWQVSM